jgi:putative transposase
MPSKPSSPEYPDTMTIRRIDHTGKVNLGGAQTFVSKLIANEPVGLLPIADDDLELYYGPVLLAQVTLKNKELQLSKMR